MAASIEFLQNANDIRQFIEFLYYNDFCISHRIPRKGFDNLSLDGAVHSVTSDLYSPGSTYYIGTAKRKGLLAFDSCGKYSHPRNVGKRGGRQAGRIVCDDKNDLEAMNVFSLLKRYFKQYYSFQRYNGKARMSCFFGPDYLNLDKAYTIDPEPASVGPGYLRIVTYKNEQFQINICNILANHEAVIEYEAESVPYWKNDVFCEYRFRFLFQIAKVSIDSFKELASAISDNSQNMYISHTQRYMAASIDTSIKYIEDTQPIFMSFVMDIP